MKQTLVEQVGIARTEALLNPFNSDTEKDVELNNKLIQLLFDYNNGDIMKLFLQVDNLAKEKQKKHENVLYHAALDGMGHTSYLSKLILEGNVKECKKTAKYHFENSDGNIASLISVCKAIFNKAEHNGSESGKWFFEKFVKLLIKNKYIYLEGGDSHDWAKTYDHLDYIKLVLEKNDKTKS
jgi:hypothetical protein